MRVTPSPNRIVGDVAVIGGNITLDNEKYYQALDTTAAQQTLAGVTSGNLIALGDSTKAMNVYAITQVRYVVDATEVAKMNTLGFEINNDGAIRSSAKGMAINWVIFNMAAASGGLTAALDSYNVTSLVDVGVGDWEVNFPTKSNANYSVLANAEGINLWVSYTRYTTKVKLFAHYLGAGSDTIVSLGIFDSTN